MLSLASRAARTVSDLTVGTIIVLAHLAIAERTRHKASLRPLAGATVRAASGPTRTAN